MRWLVLPIIAVLLGCSTEEKVAPPHFEPSFYASTISMTATRMERLTDLGVIEQVVQLETTEESLLGMINQVAVGPTGDLWIGDFDSANALFVFDANGRFKRRIRRVGQGPGEWELLLSFALDEAGDVFLATSDKLIRLGPDGAFRRETRPSVFPFQVAAAGGRIYLLGMALRDRKTDHLARIYDSGLREIARFHTGDPSFEDFSYTGSCNMALVGDQILITHYYDLAISAYALDGTYQGTLRLPSENDRIADLVTKRRLSEEEKQRLKRGLHNFIGIFSYGPGALLFDLNRPEMRFGFLKLSQTEHSLTRITGMNILDPVSQIPTLRFVNIAGTTGGFIGVLDDPEMVTPYKSKYPLLESLDLGSDNNPALVFVQVHP